MSTSSTTNSRSSVPTESERTDGDPFFPDVLGMPLAEKARMLRNMYGTCEAVYILRETYRLPYRLIMKLLGFSSLGTVWNCVQRIRSQQQYMIGVDVAKPTLADFKEACKSSAISVECQTFEIEAFMFTVAKAALPAAAFWDVFIYAKAAHRVVFPDIYNLFVDLAGWSPTRLRKLLRAVKAKDRWYVGDGVAAYVYNILDKSCSFRGYYNTRLSYNILTVIEQLTRKNPTSEPLVYLAMVVSDRLAYLINMKRAEIMQTMKAVYAAVTRMYDLD